MDGGATEIGEVESPENFGNFKTWWSISGMIIWSLILFGSFLLNGTLLLAFLKRPGLRTISNRFVMNLTVSNLLTVAVINFLLIFDKEESTSSHCSLAEGATALVTTSSIFSVLLIALDQYLAVVDPLRYRTKIDKLKCAILIFTIWIISILFCLLAAFNPNPKNLWLACNNNNLSIINNLTDNSTLNVEILIESPRNNSIPLIKIDEKIELITNKSKILNETILNNINNNDKFIFTYGFIYTITTGLIVYLLPFISICWIYINIYLAAHKNSERTRRNGSRPILSTCSFTDDYYSPIRHDMTINSDEIRRIPKISSLSSIDESIETAASQLPIQCSNKINRSLNNDENNDNVNGSGTVIFTVGAQQVDVEKKTEQQQLNAKDNIKVPIAVLKRQFLSKKYQRQPHHHHHHHHHHHQQIKTEKLNNEIKSHFNDDNEQKRKSSHDLMYDEMVLQNELIGLSVRADNLTSESSDSDEEDDEEDIIKNSDNGIRYPPLMINSDITIRDDEIMDDFKQKVQNSLSNKDNILLSRNDGHSSSNHHHQHYQHYNHYQSSENVAKMSVDNLNNSSNGVTTTPIVTITPPNKISLHRVSSTRSTTSYMNCLKYRISNASLFKYREETRAARISALVIVMGFICWTPYFIVSILKNIPVIINLSHKFDIVAMFFLIFATYVSPLLFGYRSRRVKRELRKFFCFKKELSYKNNRSLMAKKVLKRRHSGNLSNLEMDNRYNIFNCVYGRNKWPKEKVQFVQVPETALAVETCRSSFSSGASTQISSTSTDEN